MMGVANYLEASTLEIASPELQLPYPRHYRSKA